MVADGTTVWDCGSEVAARRRRRFGLTSPAFTGCDHNVGSSLPLVTRASTEAESMHGRRTPCRHRLIVVVEKRLLIAFACGPFSRRMWSRTTEPSLHDRISTIHSRDGSIVNTKSTHMITVDRYKVVALAMLNS